MSSPHDVGRDGRFVDSLRIFFTLKYFHKICCLSFEDGCDFLLNDESITQLIISKTLK